MTPPLRHSAADETQRQAIYQYNHDRFAQLNGLVVSSAEGIWQYLLAVNGGGAVAVLAFIGSVPVLQRKTWPFLVLFVFVLGLLMVAAGRAVVFHQMAALLKHWNAGFNRFLVDETSWTELTAGDTERALKRQNLSVYLAYGGLAAFLIGLGGFCFGLIRFGVP